MSKNFIALMTLIGVAVVSSAVTYAVVGKPKCNCKKADEKKSENDISEENQKSEDENEDILSDDVHNIENQETKKDTDTEKK